MIELKPCPFCGGKAVPMPVSFATEQHVACRNRECYAARAEVPAREWNSRPVEDRKDALIRELVEAIDRLAPYTDAECDDLLDRAGKEITK